MGRGRAGGGRERLGGEARGDRGLGFSHSSPSCPHPGQTATAVGRRPRCLLWWTPRQGEGLPRGRSAPGGRRLCPWDPRWPVPLAMCLPGARKQPQSGTRCLGSTALPVLPRRRADVWGRGGRPRPGPGHVCPSARSLEVPECDGKPPSPQGERPLASATESPWTQPGPLSSPKALTDKDTEGHVWRMVTRRASDPPGLQAGAA